MHIGERLKALRLKKKMSINALAIAVGMNRGNLHRIEKLGKGFSQESLSRLAAELGTNLGALYAENPSFLTVPTRLIPVLDRVKAGYYAGVNPTFRDEEMTSWVESPLHTGKRGFAFIVDGDSMLPDFKPGDYALVDPDKAYHPGDFVIAVNAAGEATLKRYAQRGLTPDGRDIFALVPSNPVYRTMMSDQEEIRVVAKVVGRVEQFT